jgi:hypothetical protein
MAIVLRGKRKGETVVIHQFANDWVSLEDGAIVSPTSLAYTPVEASRIEFDHGKGDWPYDWGLRDGLLRLRKVTP